MTAADHRAGRGAGCSTSRRSRACCSARSWPPPTAPRSSPCCAARRCGAGSRARSRRESGFNDPVAILLVLGFIDWIQQPGLRHRRHGLAVRAASSASASPSGSRSAGVGGLGASGASGSATAGPLPGRLDRRRGARVRRAPTRSTAPGFLAVYLAGLVLGGAAHPRASADDHRLPRGPRLGGADRPLPHARPARLPQPPRRRRVEGTAARAGPSPSWRGRSRRSLATAFGRFTPASGSSLGWAGLRGAVPVVLATFPVIAGVSEQRSSSSTSSSSPSSSRPCSRARPSSRWRKALGLTTDEPALPRPLAETRHDPPPRRRGASSTRSARTTRSPGARVRELGLPREALVNVIVRGGEAIPPRGSTRIEAGDRLHLLRAPGGRARASRT